ncbi:MAG: phytanoyl-CoA dioxygenase family protein [Myxococcales bacterium]|nr:phytanoyl-CoA dioxygenase family protein [Myxococcales bacterium]
MTLEDILTDLRARGCALIPDFLPPAVLTRVRARLDAMLGRHTGRNNFEGVATERIYTLIARDAVFAEIAVDPRILAVCDAVLQANYLLTASQAISIRPGETPQPWHADDSFYAIPRPRPMVSLSTIVAVDDFTEDNGATEWVPGSHRWGDADFAGAYRVGDAEEDPKYAERLADRAVKAIAPAGSCMIFAGTLVHRGGANHSGTARRAFSNQYCQPWARTQENFFLSIPPALVAGMPARLQAMLGYSIHPPFMGHVTARHPLRALEPGFEALR